VTRLQTGVWLAYWSFFAESRPDLGLTQPPIQCGNGEIFFPRVKQPWCEADHSHPSDAGVGLMFNSAQGPLYLFSSHAEKLNYAADMTPKVTLHSVKIQKPNVFVFMISYFCSVLNVVCILLGNSPASEFYMLTFRNTLFYLCRQVVMKYD